METSQAFPFGYEFVETDIDGLRALLVVSRIPEDAPHWVKEAVARRRMATITGECACGGRRLPIPRQARRLIARGKAVAPSILTIQHNNECPATEVGFTEYAKQFGAS